MHSAARFSASIFFLVFGAAASGAETASSDSEDNPRQLFLTYCASCHGGDGKGLPDLGYNLVGNAFVHELNDAGLKEFLMYGRQPGSIDSKMDLLMPAFDYLTDAELEQTVLYLRRLNGG